MRKYLSSFGRQLVAKLHHGFRLHLVFVAELVGRHLESCSFVQRAIWVLYTHLLTKMLLRTMTVQEKRKRKERAHKMEQGLPCCPGGSDGGAAGHKAWRGTRETSAWGCLPRRRLTPEQRSQRGSSPHHPARRQSQVPCRWTSTRPENWSESKACLWCLCAEKARKSKTKDK
jgi:hypothetical protein